MSASAPSPRIIGAVSLLVATTAGDVHAQTIALSGLDPVALCAGEERAGDPALTAAHGRLRYQFADAASQARFLADPSRYAIQWNGACARMGPLSGRGDPERWSVYDGKIWVFASDACRAGFARAPHGYTATAPALPKIDDAAHQRGLALFALAVEAHGGEAADAAAAVRFTRSREQQGWQHELMLLCTPTGATRRTSRWDPPATGEQRGFSTTWITPPGEGSAGTAFTTEEADVFDLCAAEEHDARRHALRELLPLLWARHQPAFRCRHRGASTLADLPVEDLEVFVFGMATTLHLARDTHRVEGISWRGRLNDGRTRAVRERFGGWTEVDGVLMPLARTALAPAADGAPAAEEWDQAALVAEIPQGAFERPEG